MVTIHLWPREEVELNCNPQRSGVEDTCRNINIYWSRIDKGSPAILLHQFTTLLGRELWAIHILESYIFLYSMMYLLFKSAKNFKKYDFTFSLF